MLLHGLIHLANVIYLVSYTVKDMRWLRWLTILGAVLLIPYFFTLNLYAPAVWNIVFLTINLWRLRSKTLVAGLSDSGDTPTDT